MPNGFNRYNGGNFYEKMKDEGFRKMLNAKFIKYTNSWLIFLKGDLKIYLKTQKFFLELFLKTSPMIPNKFHKI